MSRRNQKSKKNFKKADSRTLYFTHMARGNCTVDCNQSWHILRSRRRNQSYKFLCRSLRPFRSYTGSKFGVSHRKGERVLTLCLALPRLHVIIKLTLVYDTLELELELFPLDDFCFLWIKNFLTSRRQSRASAAALSTVLRASLVTCKRV